ncbi:hypothetical protein BLOT_001796 [Blomia tropicalis]|nr:hypothetical protein BLOT_001796 [Blomia tropicalis]
MTGCGIHTYSLSKKLIAIMFALDEYDDELSHQFACLLQIELTTRWHCLSPSSDTRIYVQITSHKNLAVIHNRGGHGAEKESPR